MVVSILFAFLINNRVRLRLDYQLKVQFLVFDDLGGQISHLVQPRPRFLQ